jgi:hypothetical protein
MFLRSTNRRKDGKDHRYFSAVENRRLPGGKTAQRTVLYLGEINDRQQAAWRATGAGIWFLWDKLTPPALQAVPRHLTARRCFRNRNHASLQL